MSESTARVQGNNQLTVDYLREKLFIGNNKFKSYSYTNSTGSEVTLSVGRIMGLIDGTGKITPSLSTATNGSQIPVGILADSYTVANGATVDVMVCIAGDVDANLIVFSGDDTSGYATYNKLGKIDAFIAVTTGAFKVTIDGTEIAPASLNFSTVTSESEIADILNANSTFNAVAVASIDIPARKLIIKSKSTGATSSVSVLSAPASGTDISGATLLNGLTGVLVTGATAETLNTFVAGITYDRRLNATGIYAVPVCENTFYDN